MGSAFTNDVYIIGDRNAPSFLAFAFLLPALAQLFFLKNKKNELGKFMEVRHLFRITIFSVIYGLANILVFTAYQSGGQASIIAPLQQVSVVLTVILSAIFLKEKEHLLRKFIASLLCVIAVVLIAI